MVDQPNRAVCGQLRPLRSPGYVPAALTVTLGLPAATPHVRKIIATAKDADAEVSYPTL
jgi:hypothetical protein